MGGLINYRRLREVGGMINYRRLIRTRTDFRTTTGCGSCVRTVLCTRTHSCSWCTVDSCRTTHAARKPQFMDHVTVWRSWQQWCGLEFPCVLEYSFRSYRFCTRRSYSMGRWYEDEYSTSTHCIRTRTQLLDRRLKRQCLARLLRWQVVLQRSDPTSKSFLMHYSLSFQLTYTALLRCPFPTANSYSYDSASRRRTIIQHGDVVAGLLTQ